MPRGKPFQIGRGKTGGRKKGTPNKVNRVLQEAFDKLITPEVAEGMIISACQHFAKGRATPLMTLLPYCAHPVAKNVPMEGIPIKFTFNFDKFSANGNSNHSNGNGNGNANGGLSPGEVINP